MINAKDIVSNNLSKSEINKNFFELSKKEKYLLFVLHVMKEISKIVPLCNESNKKKITAITMQISEI